MASAQISTRSAPTPSERARRSAAATIGCGNRRRMQSISGQALARACRQSMRAALRNRGPRNPLSSRVFALGRRTAASATLPNATVGPPTQRNSAACLDFSPRPGKRGRAKRAQSKSKFTAKFAHRIVTDAIRTSNIPTCSPCAAGRGVSLRAVAGYCGRAGGGGTGRRCPSRVAVPGFWDPRRRPERPDLSRIQTIRFLTEMDYPPFDYAAPDVIRRDSTSISPSPLR